MIKRIYIDPGHSIIDPGAVGYVVERDLNEKVSKYMNEHLQAHYVCETKVGDISIDSLSAIASEANTWGANLFVSNHLNSGGGDGYEALVHNQNRVDLGKIFAKHVQAAGQNLRQYGVAPGVKLRPDLAVLRLTSMPAVLNEGAFVDNKQDIQDWDEEHELKKLGVAYAEAAAEYLELPKKVSVPDSEPTDGGEENVQTGVYALPVLSVGSQGKAVAAMQILLIGYGYNCGGYGADGEFGDGTLGSVRNFQHDRGLEKNGVCDHDTWKSLLGVK